MEIFLNYKHASYLNRFEGETFLYSWNINEEEVQKKLNTFFQEDEIFISSREIQMVIDDIEFINLDKNSTIKVVIQKGNFNKRPHSVKSGVTVKLIFLVGYWVQDKLDWYIYGVASGIFNNLKMLNLTSEHKFAYMVYETDSVKNTEASKVLKNQLKKCFG